MAKSDITVNIDATDLLNEFNNLFMELYFDHSKGDEYVIKMDSIYGRFPQFVNLKYGNILRVIDAVDEISRNVRIVDSEGSEISNIRKAIITENGALLTCAMINTISQCICQDSGEVANYVVFVYGAKLKD